MRLHLRMMASYAMTVPSASRLRQLFAARCPASYRMSGWKEALISCPSSPTTQSVTTSPRSCESPLESPIPLSRSLFYTRSLMISGCIRVVAIPRGRSKRSEITLRLSSHAWTNVIRGISRKPSRCGHRSLNQTMQPTADPRTALVSMIKTHSFQSSLALVSGG